VIATIHKAEIAPQDTGFFVHGSTVIINALTERKGAKTALITTRGFRDVLEIGRANRPGIYDAYYTKPVPFVPRYLRFEVADRVKYRGQVLTALDEADVRAVAERCRQEGVEAIAIAFLHAYANPAHERRCAQLLAELLLDIPLTLSHEITGEWREYERTNTAVLNSYVLPAARHYLDSLARELSGMGMGTAPHVMQSNGGSATFAAARDAPIRLVESGPVAGVIGAAAIGQLIGEPNIISLDIGGTTAKCSLVERGQPRITTEYKIEYRRDFARDPILAPTGDIIPTATGGGASAWVDAAGALRIGPQSAGAVPGPACYGHGDQPTVTDAKLVAGVINTEYFLGGEIQLDVARARAALTPIAGQFGLTVEQAAMGIIRIADANMINALKLVSVRRGYDPRDFSLVAFGGGGPMHPAALPRDLRVKRVIIPTNPGVFSAWGMLMADLRQDFIRTQIVRTDKVDPAILADLSDDLEAHAAAYMRAEHVQDDRVILQRAADMRYVGQEHTVRVPLPGGVLDAARLREVDERFHQIHEKTYTFRLEMPVEIVNFHLTAIGQVAKPQVRPIGEAARSLDSALKGRRMVNFDELGYHESPIYER